jgi:hypothetical protein
VRVWKIALFLGLLVAFFLSAVTFYRVWAIGLAFAGLYAAVRGRLSYRISGGPTLGEVHGWWVRLGGILLCVIGIAVAVNAERTCEFFARHGRCT